MSESLQSSAVSAAEEKSRVDQNPATAFGRARELHDAGYKEMPPKPAGGADQTSFGSDYSGFVEAADDLAASRQPTRNIVARQYLTGDSSDVDEAEAVTLRRAADDLQEARAADAAALEHSSSEQPAFDGDQRGGQARPADLLHENTSPPGYQDASEIPADSRDGDHLDPILQEALKHPQVREAIEGEIGKADAARQNYDLALDAVSGLLRDVVFAQFPELRSDTVQQFETALAQLSQRDPSRYAQARGLADRLSVLQSARSQQQQERDAAQRREFAEYAKAEDARFDAMVKGEPPAVVQKVSDEIIAYAGELGVPRQQFLQLCASEPIMRNAAFQKMMFDAASYRLLQRARSEVAKKVVPPVQRPGVAVDTRAAMNEGDVRALSARFTGNPSVKNAADVLAAQRRGARGGY
jgi:hypothetical protein